MPAFDYKTVKLPSKLMATCETSKIEFKNYWDSHGKKIPYPNTEIKFDEVKKVEIICEPIKYIFSEDGLSENNSYVVEFWNLYVDGKKINEGEVTSFRETKTKLVVESCIGSG